MTYLEQLRAYWERTATRMTLERPGTHILNFSEPGHAKYWIEAQRAVNNIPSMLALPASTVEVMHAPAWRDAFDMCALTTLRTGWLGQYHTGATTIPVVTDAFDDPDARFITHPMLVQFDFVPQTVRATATRPNIVDCARALQQLAQSMGFQFAFDAPESSGSMACIIRQPHAVRPITTQVERG